MNAVTPIDEPRTLSYAEAIREVMTIAMDADPTVILMGEDIGVYGGAFEVTFDLVDRFGPVRVKTRRSLNWAARSWRWVLH